MASTIYQAHLVKRFAVGGNHQFDGRLYVFFVWQSSGVLKGSVSCPASSGIATPLSYLYMRMI